MATLSTVHPSFSVVIPAFNYGHYVSRAIDSVLAQCPETCELIVVDDGSTDATAKVAEGYGPRVRLIRQARGGPYAACYRGLDASTGEFLIFLDADDEMRPGALATFARALRRAPHVRMVFGRYNEIDESGRTKTSRSRARFAGNLRNFENYLVGRLLICTGAAAIHRSRLERMPRLANAPYNSMDRFAIAQILLHDRCLAVPEILLDVHAHPGRLRDNVDTLRSDGRQVLSLLFDSRVVTSQAMQSLRKVQAAFASERGRAFYKAGSYPEAVAQYEEGFRCHKRALLDARNVRRYAVARWQVLRSLHTDASRLEPDFPPTRGERSTLLDVPPSVWNRVARKQLTNVPKLLHDWFEKSGASVLRLPAAKPIVMLCHPTDVQHVLVTNARAYGRAGILPNARSLLGKSLLSTDGTAHAKLRHRLQPIFHRKRAAQFLNVIERALENRPQPRQPELAFDISHWAFEASTTMSAVLTFGLEDAAETQRLIQATRAVHYHENQQFVRREILGTWGSLQSFRRARRARRIRDAVLREQVAQCRQGVRRGASLAAELLDLQGRIGKKQMRDSELLHHVRTTFVTGYDPPANAVFWTLYELSRHPDWLAAVKREVDDASLVCGQQRLEALPTCRQVISESIRLHPSPWVLWRRALVGDQLPSGARVIKGERVCVSLYSLHRGDAFDAPDEFRPERFDAATARTSPLGSFLPFACGPHRCAGESLGWMFMLLMLADFVARYEFVDQPPVIDSETVNLFTTQPAQPWRAQLRVRHVLERSPQREPMSAQAM